MMHAITETAPRLSNNDGKANQRAVALAEIDGHLDDLRLCIHWLVAQGVAVLSVDMRRGKALPSIEVAPSPWLQVLFKDDCANVGRRQDGALTVFAWVAKRYGCDIRWHEVQA